MSKARALHKNASRRKIIQVPREFLQHDLKLTSTMICKHLMTFAIPLVIATIALLLLQPIISVPLAIFLCVFSSIGLHSLGLMGHEGTHFTLHPNRLISAYIGIIISSMVPLHLDMGFAIRHNQHHRFTNTEKDPDLKAFGRFKTLWERMFLARVCASNDYLITTVKLAIGGYPAEWDSMLNLSRGQITWLARVNILASLFFTSMYTLIAERWSEFGFALLGTLVFAILISGLRPYLEHAGTDHGRTTHSRTWISPVFDFLYAGINYHLAHHLAPAVPAYRIKQFHEWLIDQQHINRNETIEITSIGEAFEVICELPYGSRL